MSRDEGLHPLAQSLGPPLQPGSWARQNSSASCTWQNTWQSPQDRPASFLPLRHLRVPQRRKQLTYFERQDS